MNNRYTSEPCKRRGLRRLCATLGLISAYVLAAGCASRSVDQSFEQLSSSIDRFALSVAPLDLPRDCGGARPPSLMLNVRFNGSCPMGVLPAENGCVDQKSRNVVCVCRNNVGTEEINWQSVDADGNAIAEDYQLYFDPFKSGPAFSADGQGRIKNKKLINAPPVTSQGETIQFKYTVFKPGCDPVDPRIIIGQ